MKLRSVTFLCLLLTLPVYAWNAMGHPIIAVIAADHLSAPARQQSRDLVNYLANAYPYSSSWQMASAWADILRQDGMQFFDQWHYDDQPYQQQATPVQPVTAPNSVWALNQANAVLTSSHSNQYEKAFALRFLLHLTGDAHQPLHDVQLFSPQFPQGDRGGNLYVIADRKKNLHAAWDSGLGFFHDYCQLSWSNTRRAQCLARKIEHDFPEHYFGQQVNDLNPQDWVDQGYAIAIHFAYQTPLYAPLSTAYCQKGQIIVEQQLALAGYRLAKRLNQL